MKIRIMQFTLFILIFLCAGLGMAMEVFLTAGDATGAPGDDVAINVRFDGCPSPGVMAVQFTLLYDASLVDVNSVELGSFPSGWSFSHQVQNGKILISMAGVNTLCGKGQLLDIGFNIKASAQDGAESALEFENIQINEGAVSAAGIDGSIKVQAASPDEATLSLGNATAQPGDAVLIPVSISDVTGMGLISASLIIDYDPAVLTFSSVKTTSMTSGWQKAVNPTSGRVTISLMNTTPMTGSGDFLKLHFDVKTTALEGTSALSFDSAELNEGGIAVQTQDGQVLVKAPQGGVQLNLPATLETAAGSVVDIPVEILDTAGLDIFAIAFDFVFPAAVSVQGVNGGSVIQGWSVLHNETESGRLAIAAAGANTLSDDGTLLTIRVKVVSTAQPGAKLPISLENADVNEGQYAVDIQNGKIIIADAYSLSGRVSYFMGQKPVPAVDIHIKSDGNKYKATTDKTGMYSKSDLNPAMYTVLPNSTTKYDNAISPYDASMVLRHVVGNLQLDAQQIKAGDVSGNKSLSALDASHILRYVVDDIVDFPINKVWSFEPESTSVNLNQDMQKDFTGILLGDVSGNWGSSGSLAKAADEIKVSIPDTIVSENQNIKIPVVIKGLDNESIYSFAIQIDYDSTKAQLLMFENPTSITASWGSVIYQKNETGVKAAAAGVLPLTSDGVLFNLVFNLKEESVPVNLLINELVLNEGEPTAIVKSGSVCYNITPREFNLISPGNQSEIESVPIQFSWEAAQDSEYDEVKYIVLHGTDLMQLELDTLLVTTDTEFSHEFANANTTYYWKVVAVDNFGAERSCSKIFSYTSTITDVSIGDAVPIEFSLAQNFPNPFNPKTTIHFSVPEPARIRLEIFNLLGDRVGVLTNRVYKTGKHSIVWQGTNTQGEFVPSGIYLLRMSSGDYENIIRMTICK